MNLVPQMVFTLSALLYILCVHPVYASSVKQAAAAPHTHELMGLVEAENSPLRDWYRIKSEGCVQLFLKCKQNNSARACIGEYQSCQVKYYDKYQQYRRDGYSYHDLE